MSKRYISKGELQENGLRRLDSHVQDADGRWREELVELIDDSFAEDRIALYLMNGQFDGRWPEPET